MPGIDISEIKTIAVKDSNGWTIKPGDKLLIRTSRGEDIVCVFSGVSGGYFTTTTLDGETENKYRVASIERCQIMDTIILRKDRKNG